MSEDGERYSPDRSGLPVEGPVSLFVDDTIDFPLWDRGGPIEGGRTWLKKELGISYEQIDGLFRLMDRYDDGGQNTREEEVALWGRLQVELKPHLRMPDPPVPPVSRWTRCVILGREPNQDGPDHNGPAD